MINHPRKNKKVLGEEKDNQKQKAFQKKLQEEISGHCIFLSYDCFGTLKASTPKTSGKF